MKATLLNKNYGKLYIYVCITYNNNSDDDDDDDDNNNNNNNMTE